jgi:molybdopterin/thiamine biosynthesis adenylyltransferase
LHKVTWLIENPRRFLYEREQIESLESDVDWLSTQWSLATGEVTVEFYMTVHGVAYEGTLTYPALFPDTPAYIHPKDSTDRWSEHQYGVGGSLCLEYRADNWSSNITGAMLIESAYKLLMSEKHPERPVPVPSAHALLESQTVRGTFSRFALTQSIAKHWTDHTAPATHTFNTSTVFNKDCSVTYVSSFTNSSQEEIVNADLPEIISSEQSFISIKKRGYFYCHQYFDGDYEVKSVSGLNDLIVKQGFTTDDVFIKSENDDYLRTIIVLKGSALSSLRVFELYGKDELKLYEHKVLFLEKNVQRLPENNFQLSTRKVGIVGLGSLGSKVATSLARSGFKEFLLVDDDYFSVGNIARNELTFADVGRNKVDAVSNKIELLANDVNVETKTSRINGQESSLVMANTLKKLSECDILVDATANPDVSIILASIANKHKVALYWGEIFAGGCGGIIARAHPEYDPNPNAVRDGIFKYCETLPAAPFKSAHEYGDAPMIAYDSDVGFIASALTRLIIDGSVNGNGSVFPQSAYLIGMSNEWDFEQFFDVRPIQIGDAKWAEPVEKPTEQDIKEMLGILEKMLPKKALETDD